MKAPENFSGEKFAEKFGSVMFWEDGKGDFHCPSLPELTDADLIDCVISPVYSISPKSELIATGETLEVTVTGAAGDYVIVIDDVEYPITIDETGVEVIEIPAIDAGTYYIKGTGLLSQCVAKVEVI